MTDPIFLKKFLLDTMYRPGVISNGLYTLLFTAQSRLLTTLYKKPVENIAGKGENAGNQHFLLFPQCFQAFPNQISILQSHLFCCLQMPSIWTSQKFCCLVKSEKSNIHYS